MKEKIKKLKKEIREELEKGIKRNDVLPLDWAMDRIEPIIEKALKNHSSQSKIENVNLVSHSVKFQSANTLKTLKDFETEEIFGKVEGDKDGMVIAPFEYISKNELKAEAVKRARYFKERIKWAKEKDFRVKEKLDAYFQGRFNEVMEANDLTEKDLE